MERLNFVQEEISQLTAQWFRENAPSDEELVEEVLAISVANTNSKSVSEVSSKLTPNALGIDQQYCIPVSADILNYDFDKLVAAQL